MAARLLVLLVMCPLGVLVGSTTASHAQPVDCVEYGDYDPAPAPLVGGAATPAPAIAVEVYGNHAFVACGEAGIAIYDLSDPQSPALVGTLDTPGFAHDVGVDEEFACVADGESGLQVVDISQLSAPTIVSAVDTPGDARAVALVRHE